MATGRISTKRPNKSNTPKEDVEKKSVVKAALPQILSVLGDQEEDADAIVLLLEEGADLQTQLGSKPTDTKEGSGLLGRLHEIKEELGQRQSLLDLEGIRHNNIAFVMSRKDGRSTFSQDKAKKALMSAGVDVKIIAKAFKAATGRGESFYERELAIIKEGK